VSGRFTKFARGDVGKVVEIKSGAVTVDGIKRHVDWGESAHPDCCGKIESVETRVKGHVKLEDGSFFENCAILSIDELSTSALVSNWIKDPAVTGDERLADRPECDLARFSRPYPIPLRHLGDPPDSYHAQSELINPCHVRPPKYFISHAWQGRFVMLLDGVLSALRNASDDTAVWLDFVAVNQHNDTRPTINQVRVRP
jgi:hypothetical protein